jgi:CheY-like chemotaxis protein
LARKLLLADDSVTAQNMGRRILTDAGYEVTTVNNGSAALKRIAESKPDLIILDVYMPGYGGLEVCQRLREAPETARIPVLLTVGKLEPFKADDTRRVRADGFIVKPFDASELLTALAKLEDKIVPQIQPHKRGRFAKALGVADDAAQVSEYGDSATGWKDRLTIPPPHKPREFEPEEVPAASTQDAGSVVQSYEPKPSEMKSGVEEALLAASPADVTPEEIAAIQAAAAVFTAPSDESWKPGQDQRTVSSAEPAVEPETARTEEHPRAVAGSQDTATVTFASVPETPAETQSGRISAESQPTFAETAGRTSADPAATAPTAPAVPEPAAEVASSNAGPAIPADDEVTAALASLTPAHNQGNGDARINGVSSDHAAHDRDLVMPEFAKQFQGPRWTAETMPLSGDESTVCLEHEMQQVHAALAAADAARIGSAATESKHEMPAPQSAATTSDPETMPPAVAPTGQSPASDSSAAYAAAASATANVGQPATNAEMVSAPATASEVSENAASESDRQGEGELASAWANWRQIRDTVLSAHVADGGVPESKADPKNEPQVEASSESTEEGSDIANIVDSVLADLKPKLMEEIKKKMGKESKKKR